MQAQDYDEDIYEETTSKIVYSKRSSTSHPRSQDISKEHTDIETTNESEKYSGGTSVREAEDHKAEWTELNKQQSSQDEIWSSYAEAALKPKAVDASSIRETENQTDTENQFSRAVAQSDVSKDTVKSGADDEQLHSAWTNSDLQTSEKVKEEMKEWAERARLSKLDIDGHFSIGKDSSRSQMRDIKSSEGQTYYAVAKWEVDYNNKNFVRSKCNKPRGHHRYVFGRPFEWEVDYGSKYYLRSKVNPPKGLHRRGGEMKRKKVPDIDILADSTGWEFEYGPEFHQTEGDVPFHRMEKIVGKGGYRFYGVKRNNSDTDRKIEEIPYEFKEYFEDEFKYGHEFLQDDVPHIVEHKDRRIGRGGYRYRDVERSRCDTHPQDFPGVDYKSSRATIQSEINDQEKVAKGKPFKRTVLKKTFRLIKPDSAENFVHGTVLTLVPGTGSKVYHEGKSTRPSPSMPVKKYPSIKDYFKSKVERDRRHLSSSDIQTRDINANFNRRHRGSSVQKTSSRRNIIDKRHSVDQYRDKETDYGRRYSFDNYESTHKKETAFKRPKAEYHHSGHTTSTEQHRFPPEVQNRIMEIKNRIPREITESRKTKQDHYRKRTSTIHKGIDEESEIDWRNHDDHPFDHGKSITEGYEKYVNERGSEIWIKTKESYKEFHHKAGR